MQSHTPLTQEMQTQSVSDAVKIAANNFVLVSVKVSFWDGKGKLSAAAERAAIKAGANPRGVEMTSRLLGDFHSNLQEVNRHFRRPRTYLNSKSIPYAMAKDDGQRRGDKMLHVSRYPKVIGKLQELQATAFESLTQFLANYDQYRSQALDNDFGAWRSEAERLFPTAQEVRRKFAIEISDPKPLPVFSEAQQASFNVPASVMAKIVEQSNAAIAAQLEGAKQDQIKTSLDACETALKQLTDGKRLSNSIIENVKQEAVKLAEISSGYDNDPRIKAIAKGMAEGIANVTDKDQWRDNAGKKLAAKSAAENAVKNLKRMAKAAPVATVPDTSGVILPEITADLI